METMGAMTWRDRLRAWFDRTMDRGTPALIAWLGIASLLLVVVVTLLTWLFTGADVDANGGWDGVLWRSLLRTLDPGTMGGDAGTAPFLALMLTVTVGGIFLVSSLIGVLTTGLENQITQLRRGRSRVVERGHIVILGWSDQVFTIVAELMRANAGGPRTSVVILAERDKLDMEEQIRAQVGPTGRTRVIYRSGNPLKRALLELTATSTAPSRSSWSVRPAPTPISTSSRRCCCSTTADGQALDRMSWPLAGVGQPRRRPPGRRRARLSGRRRRHRRSPSRAIPPPIGTVGVCSADLLDFYR